MCHQPSPLRHPSRPRPNALLTRAAILFHTRRPSRSYAAPPLRSSTSSTVVVSPTVVVGGGYSPFGFHPFGGFYSPFSFFAPVYGFGSLFQFMFIALILGVVFNAIKGAASAVQSNKKEQVGGRSLRLLLIGRSLVCAVGYAAVAEPAVQLVDLQVYALLFLGVAGFS